jgi:hypothetical protein
VHLRTDLALYNDNGLPLFLLKVAHLLPELKPQLVAEPFFSLDHLSTVHLLQLCQLLGMLSFKRPLQRRLSMAQLAFKVAALLIILGLRSRGQLLMQL